MNEWNNKNCKSQPTTAEPIKTPVMEPIPPKITSTSTVIDTWSAKFEGNRIPCFTDDSTPATPEVDAPMAKAITLYFRPLIPSDAAATSSSRMAAQERPTLELFSDVNKIKMGIKNARSR